MGQPEIHKFISSSVATLTPETSYKKVLSIDIKLSRD